jgi:hypothetical protein
MLTLEELRIELDHYVPEGINIPDGSICALCFDIYPQWSEAVSSSDRKKW